MGLLVSAMCGGAAGVWVMLASVPGTGPGVINLGDAEDGVAFGVPSGAPGASGSTVSALRTGGRPSTVPLFSSVGPRDLSADGAGVAAWLSGIKEAQGSCFDEAGLPWPDAPLEVQVGFAADSIEPHRARIARLSATDDDAIAGLDVVLDCLVEFGSDAVFQGWDPMSPPVTGVLGPE